MANLVETALQERDADKQTLKTSPNKRPRQGNH